MIILLIVWFLFLFGFVIFNVYGLYRIVQMRIPDDASMLAILVYVIILIIIIGMSVMFVSRLNWSTNLPTLF